MSKTSATFNKNLLQLSSDLLQITVLGGVRIEGLDRMRVTLKIEVPDSPRPAVRHNLDLYNDTQVEKLIRKVAERMEIGTSVVSAFLSELTSELETYRLEKLKETEPTVLEERPLSGIEKQEALSYLETENLLERTMEDLQGTGIIGEEINSMILYLAMSSRKCSDPLSVISLAKSGVGKSYLQEKVSECIPEGELLENTQFTENSFYYFKRAEIRGKVFLIEDLDGAQGVLYPIRELQSKKRISKTVTAKDKTGQLRTMTLVVEGPVSVIGCTTRERIYEDNANRSILIYLDGSKEQDKRIMDYQRALKAGKIDRTQEIEKRRVLKNTQRLLEPITIKNPYAELLELPESVFKPRRTMSLFLSFVEAITFYHQKQRALVVDKPTGEIFIETTPEDIKWAFKLLKETLFRKSDELSGACRQFYEGLKGWLSVEKREKFYASDIRKNRRINPRTLQRYLKELSEYNYLQITGGNKYKTGYEYTLSENAPTENLMQFIDEHINRIMQQVKTLHAVRQKAVKPKRKVASKPKSVST